MDAQAVEEAPLARHVAPEPPAGAGEAVEAAPADADVITDRHGHAVHGVLLALVEPLVRLGQQGEQGLPRGLRDGVQAAAEAARRQGAPHVAVLGQDQGRQPVVAPDAGGGHEGDGHDLGGGHPGLRVVPVAPGAQEVVAQAVDRDDLCGEIRGKIVGHGCPRCVVGGTSTLPEDPPCACARRAG